MSLSNTGGNIRGLHWDWDPLGPNPSGWTWCDCGVIDECAIRRVSKSVYSVWTQDSTGSVVLPYRQVLSSPYPSTHIDVDINTVKQMPPCHEHMYHQRRYMQAELSALWKTNSEDEISPDHLINIQESFTPDLYVLSHIVSVLTFSHWFLCPSCCLIIIFCLIWM